MEIQSNIHEARPPRAPNTVQEAAEAPAEPEVIRLEELLLAKSRELRAFNSEHARQASLMRELASRVAMSEPASSASVSAAAPTSDRDPGLEALRVRCEAATERVLDAEASRAEAIFKLDEVMGALKAASAVGSDGADANNAGARLEGTVRGLRSALAELTEARDATEARLILALHDVEDGVDREKSLERSLIEAREQLELALATAHTTDAGLTADTHEHARMEAELVGLRMRADEAEQAVDALRAALVSATRRLAELGDQLGIARAELGATRGTGASMEASINEMELQLARERRRVVELHDSLQSVGGELRGRESDASELRTEREQLRQRVDDLEGHDLARRDSLQATASVSEHARQRAAGDVTALRQVLADTRDALVALGAGVEHLTSGPTQPQATDGMTTVAGEIDAPDGPQALELQAQLKTRDDRIDQLERRHVADTDTHTASVASSRAQLELSRGEASALREELSLNGARLEAARVAARSIRTVLDDESSVQPRVAELLQLLAD